MNIFTSIPSQRSGRKPRHAAYVTLSVSDAIALVERDCRLNGYDGLRADRHFANADFRAARNLPEMDLPEAIRVGIERNAHVQESDPLYAEKVALRAKQSALLGDLNQPINVRVSGWPSTIRPKAYAR